MVRPQLFTKNIGLSCIGARFEGFHSPVGAKTYNQVTGIGSKGRFEITSFHREDGSLAKRVSRYLDEADNETLTITNLPAGGGGTRQVTAINRVVREFVSRVFSVDKEKNTVVMVENRLVNSPNAPTRDFHRIAHFYAGKPSREISFEPRWDGLAPDVIHYKNVKGKLPQEGLEYLPLAVTEYALPRYKHVAHVQMKKYGLEGMVPEVELVKTSDLNPGCKTIDEANEKFGCAIEGAMESTPPSGQVSISNEMKTSFEIIGTLAHEYKHVDDLSKVLRLQYNVDSFRQLSLREIAVIRRELPEVFNFVKKSFEKGIISKKGPDDFEYRHLKYLDRKMMPDRYFRETETLEGHKIHPVEVGPKRVEKEEVTKFDSLLKNIVKLLKAD